ncbi:MAG TPA: Stk1 family PASTA domain-containing Ser/Thr kinase, partial [Ornithinibacter sp.]|nr:Stk1 family PASTA domain-containing Ser/Thr kinase [Ornithinibacter sp.]
MAEVPTLLGGRYEVGDLLGRGGMAEVHRGYDTRLGRPVAIKMLRTELARDSTFLARFRREAQAAAGLNHSSIVAVYDHGEDVAVEAGGAPVKVPYIVMEFVDGRTLRELITERGSLPPGEALRMTEGVLDALAYSHRSGIVHRDIKPANVMIAADGSIKVMDFGIARAMADANATMTQTSAVIGTAQYLSPEQAQGQPVDERSDLYSTGCMLFELLTGRPPFLGDSAVSIAYQHVGEPPLPPSRLVEGLSDDIDAVVLHSLAKPRDARYQNAGEFRADLQAVRLGRPISDAARGSAAAFAGAAAGAAVVAGAAATEALPALGGEETMAYAGGPVAPVAPPPGSSTETLPGSEDPEKKRNPVMIILLVLAALAALGALAWGLLSGLGDDEKPQVSVPAVVGLPEPTALARIAQAKLVAQSTTAASDTVPEGEVISQEPEEGTEVDEGSTVRITVSAGPSAITVPDLRGKTV